MKLIFLALFPALLFSSGGYDHGTSAGKGNLDLSLTWNPFNFIKEGQSYAVLGYGLTNKIDLHLYYSSSKGTDDNYYFGLFYQFYKSQKLDLATAVGVRKFSNQSVSHFFFPQLLYTFHINKKLKLGGSIVQIRNYKIKKRMSEANDLFLVYNIKENKKYKIDFTAGGFNPGLWKPSNGNWHPTYSIDIKFKF